jgi:hypothetical protein
MSSALSLAFGNGRMAGRAFGDTIMRRPTTEGRIKIHPRDMDPTQVGIWRDPLLVYDGIQRARVKIEPHSA